MVVEFFENGTLITGLVKGRTEGKLKVILENHREKYISKSQIALECDEEGDIAEISSRRKKLSDEIDIKTLWETLLGCKVKEVCLDEMAALWFQNIEPDNIAATLKALYSPRNFFFTRKGKAWLVNPPERARELEIQRRKEEERKRKEEEFLKWLKTGEGKPPDEILAELKKLFIKGQESGKKILKEIGGKGELRKILIRAGAMDEDENIYLERFSIPQGYIVSPKIKIEGEDMTHLDVLTLDTEGTRIRDDGVSLIEETPESFRIGIHIADIPEGVDEEVIRRGESIYFPEGKIDMLPLAEKLSLDEGVERASISIIAKISKEGELVDYNVKMGIIKVRKNLSFEEAETEEEYKEVLEKLSEIGNILGYRRRKIGGLARLKEDIELRVKNGEIFARKIVPNDLRIAISEIMMMAGYIIGLFAVKRKIPMFFREGRLEIADTPDSETLWGFWKIIRAVRSRTTVNPSGNEFIGFNPYAWGTSPIRRGYDFFNIKQMKRIIRGQSTLSQDEMVRIFGMLEKSLSSAQMCEHSRFMHWLIRYIEKEGREFEGVFIEDGPKEAVVYCDNLCMYLKAPKPRQKIEVGSRISLLLKTDIVNLTIRAIIK